MKSCNEGRESAKLLACVYFEFTLCFLPPFLFFFLQRAAEQPLAIDCTPSLQQLIRVDAASFFPFIAFFFSLSLNNTLVKKERKVGDGGGGGLPGKVGRLIDWDAGTWTFHLSSRTHRLSLDYFTCLVVFPVYFFSLSLSLAVVVAIVQVREMAAMTMTTRMVADSASAESTSLQEYAVLR